MPSGKKPAAATASNGTTPRVDVVHLHHGVWLNLRGRDLTSPLPERFFAALSRLTPEARFPLVAIVVSEEAATYRPEFLWLGEKLRGLRRLKSIADAPPTRVRRGPCQEVVLTGDDVDYLVPHQANLRIIDACRERMGLGCETFNLGYLLDQDGFQLRAFGLTGAAKMNQCRGKAFQHRGIARHARFVVECRVFFLDDDALSAGPH